MTRQSVNYSSRKTFSRDKIFFTSDLHFDHGPIIGFCNRPYRDVNEMNESLIDNWNSVVKNSDSVFMLGDIFFGKDYERLRSLIEALNGHKYLIRGNHDKFSNDVYKLLGFKDSADYMEILADHQLIILSHYPMITWCRCHRGSWMLYGHVHGTYEPIRAEMTKLQNINPYVGVKTMDVGIDVSECNYTPFSYKQIEEKMSTIS